MPLHTVDQPDSTHWMLWCHGVSAFDACFRLIQNDMTEVAREKLPNIQLTDDGKSFGSLGGVPFTQLEIRFTQWGDQHAIAIRQALPKC